MPPENPSACMNSWTTTPTQSSITACSLISGQQLPILLLLLKINVVNRREISITCNWPSIAVKLTSSGNGASGASDWLRLCVQNEICVRNTRAILLGQVAIRDSNVGTLGREIFYTAIGIGVISVASFCKVSYIRSRNILKVKNEIALYGNEAQSNSEYSFSPWDYSLLNKSPKGVVSSEKGPIH